MDTFEKIEKVKKVTKAAAKGVELPLPAEELARVAPNKEQFDNLLKQAKNEKVTLEKNDPSRRSLLDEVRDMGTRNDKPTVITPTELVAQAEQAANKMGEMKNALQQPGATLRDSAVPLLRNKISHIDENIKIALNKAGVEVKGATPVAPPSDNPVMRFLGFLTDGQYQLGTLATEVDKWHLNKVDINPATMLSLQIKVGFITQEIEFFSSLLNKALESTKTIMNVQV